MYLLDSDIIIYSLKGNKTVVENLQIHINDPIKISIVTLMELYYGAYKSQRIESNLAKIKTIDNNIEKIPIGIETAEIFGILKSKQEKSGKSLDDFDLILASTALAHNLILVTNNEKHFERIEGLVIENWSKKG
ncbi:MAG: type II toxin-antitoxin system VapC family toxin [Spirochaetota bacterium]